MSLVRRSILRPPSALRTDHYSPGDTPAAAGADAGRSVPRRTCKGKIPTVRVQPLPARGMRCSNMQPGVSPAFLAAHAGGAWLRSIRSQRNAIFDTVTQSCWGACLGRAATALRLPRIATAQGLPQRVLRVPTASPVGQGLRTSALWESPKRSPVVRLPCIMLVTAPEHPAPSKSACTKPQTGKPPVKMQVITDGPDCRLQKHASEPGRQSRSCGAIP